MLSLKVLGAILAAAVVPSYAYAEDFSAKLSGFNEIGSIPTSVTVTAFAPPPAPTTYTGAILSDGSGTVELNLDKNAGTIAYKLTYSNVGTTPPKTGSVLFAHIHFGKSRDSGGVLVYFCSNVMVTVTGPSPPPSCNTDATGSGTVSGVWKAANVQAIAGQNVNAGDFDALVDALESDTAYANIHTSALPGGEIRGQCRSGDREDQGNQED